MAQAVGPTQWASAEVIGQGDWGAPQASANAILISASRVRPASGGFHETGIHYRRRWRSVAGFNRCLGLYR
jgi:hypothetical protein